MARGSRTRRRLASRRYRLTPYPLPSCGKNSLEKDVNQKSSKALEKKDWEDATCSVCMEFPHNAVLLLCSSHDKGCRPYMCGTSYRYSNCLNQFKKAYTKVMSPHHNQDQEGPWHRSADSLSAGSNTGWPNDGHEVMDLACPLCRGQVKGWTVVEAAREYLNAKKRCCMQDDCSFVGTYRELRKHMRMDHPFARPREVDPVLEQKWRRLEREREHDDVMSTIRSSMPGAMIFGDYVIEGAHHGFHMDHIEGEDEDREHEVGMERSLLNVLFLLEAFGSPGNASLRSRLRRSDAIHLMLEEAGRVGTRATIAATSGGNNLSPASRAMNLERSERRRRRRSQRRSIIDMT